MSLDSTMIMVNSIEELNCLSTWPMALSISAGAAEQLTLAEGSSEHVQELYESIYDYKQGTRYHYLYFRFRSMPNELAYRIQFTINWRDEIGWLDDRVICRLVELRQVTTIQWVDVEPLDA